jgi:small subunit ribosomal protein S6
LRQYVPDPRHYELMTILSPEVPDDEITAHLDQIVGYVASNGGEILEVNRESPWGRRRLAYAIRHHGRDVRDGYYTVFRFRVAPGGIAEIERDLSLHDLLIRHLITQQDEPAPVEIVEAPLDEAATAATAEVSVGPEVVASAATEAPPAEAAEPEPADVPAAIGEPEAEVEVASTAETPMPDEPAAQTEDAQADETAEPVEAPIERPAEASVEPAATEEPDESPPVEAVADEPATVAAAPDDAPATEPDADAGESDSAPPSAPQSAETDKEE